MNLAIISFGVLLGWCCLLSLPWILTSNTNPLDSTAGYVMLAPLLIPILILGESRGGRCPDTLHARLKWIARNSKYAQANFFAIGLVHGLIFAIPSAIMITLTIAYTLNSASVTSLIILVVTGLMHLALFVFSFFVAFHNVANWGKRIYQSKRGRDRLDA